MIKQEALLAYEKSTNWFVGFLILILFSGISLTESESYIIKADLLRADVKDEEIGWIIVDHEGNRVY